MTMQETVAANVRARLGWSRVAHEDAARAAGCSIRSFRSKISGSYGFRPNELAGLAKLFGMDDLGDFYRVPAGFSRVVAIEESVSAWTRSYAAHGPWRSRSLRTLARAA